MNIESIIDDYITREPRAEVVGYCEWCNDLIEGSQNYREINSRLYCCDDCLLSDYKVEFKSSVVYCDNCDYAVEDEYIADCFGNTFCNTKCLIEYYNR